MKIAIFGLSLSSSWGNGHATTWRALVKALAARGHKIVFFEREAGWYRAHRDLPDPEHCKLVLYEGTARLEAFSDEIGRQDAVIVGSYVPDGIEIAEWVLDRANGVVAYYDIDTPVTLEALDRGDCPYLSTDLVRRFDVHFSFSGGRALEILKVEHGARRPVALHCGVDTSLYRPVAPPRRWALGYLGTYSADRQAAVEALLIEPARARPDLEFVVAGPQYPDDIEWPQNVMRIEHVPPAAHPAFYCQLGLALNVTRRQMVELGHSPSVRLFEAAACGAAIVSDAWPGLSEVFEPDREILVVEDTRDVLAILDLPEPVRAAIGRAARERALSSHSARARAETLLAAIAEARADRFGDNRERTADSGRKSDVREVSAEPANAGCH